jgi:CRP-like cAMP-binding protein
MFEIIHKLLDTPEFKNKVKFKIKTYQAHEKIVSEGTKNNYMYLIKKGRARVIVHGDKKEIQTLSPGIADLGPNDVFRDGIIPLRDF